jgi:hypothetical protein
MLKNIPFITFLVYFSYIGDWIFFGLHHIAIEELLLFRHLFASFLIFFGQST